MTREEAADLLDNLIGMVEDNQESDYDDALKMAIEALRPDGDTISRQAAIDALWKALFEYEDKTEKQFQESEELDVGDWIQHRIFVQNMSDIDRQVILDLPSTQREGKWMFSPDHAEGICTSCHYKIYGRPYQNTYLIVPFNYCPNCGAEMKGEEDETD